VADETNKKENGEWQMRHVKKKKEKKSMADETRKKGKSQW